MKFFLLIFVEKGRFVKGKKIQKIKSLTKVHVSKPMGKRNKRKHSSIIRRKRLTQHHLTINAENYPERQPH